MGHVVTTHIQSLIKNGLFLAQQVDNRPYDYDLNLPETVLEQGRSVRPPEVLRAAADDLIHAAAELRMEAKACEGWRQR